MFRPIPAPPKAPRATLTEEEARGYAAQALKIDPKQVGKKQAASYLHPTGGITSCLFDVKGSPLQAYVFGLADGSGAEVQIGRKTITIRRKG